jgi:nucleoside-diphosphate-sugar epimerase
VGVPTIRALIDRGHTVRAMDIEERPALAELGVEVQVGDVGDPDACARAVEGVESVVHLAVLPLNLANEDTTLAFDSNVKGSFNVFRAAGEAGVGRVVYSSASSAYGPTTAVPIDNAQALEPNAFYAASKAAAEMLLRGLAGAYGFSFVILRYMNVYGPGQRAGVVPAVARAMLGGDRPQLTGDGEQSFDFVHVDDCVSANVAALESDASGVALNVGSGDAASLNEVVRLMGEVLGNPVEPVYDGDPSSAPPRVGSIEATTAEIGYRPGIGLRDGLESVLDELRAAGAAA